MKNCQNKIYMVKYKNGYNLNSKVYFNPYYAYYVIHL